MSKESVDWSSEEVKNDLVGSHTRNLIDSLLAKYSRIRPTIENYINIYIHGHSTGAIPNISGAPASQSNGGSLFKKPKIDVLSKTENIKSEPDFKEFENNNGDYVLFKMYTDFRQIFFEYSEDSKQVTVFYDLDITEIEFDKICNRFSRLGVSQYHVSKSLSMENEKKTFVHVFKKSVLQKPSTHFEDGMLWIVFRKSEEIPKESNTFKKPIGSQFPAE